MNSYQRGLERRLQLPAEDVTPGDVPEEGVHLDGFPVARGRAQPLVDLSLEELPDEVAGVGSEVRRQVQFPFEDLLYGLLSILCGERRLQIERSDTRVFGSVQ